MAARAQQATALPPVVVEQQVRQVKATNSRLDSAGPASAQPSAQSSGPSAGSTTEGGAAVGSQSNEPVSGSAAASTSESGGINGASTAVISREQIERSSQATLPDIIGREAGVQTWSTYGGVNGAGTTVDMRGFGATASANTLVLIDGRRLNDWDLAGFDLSSIAKDSIERIEITRGNSGAVLYGDGAVGGVINIVTRSGAALPNQVRVEGGYGSFGTREGNVSASASSGGFSAYLNGNTLKSDGYRVNNALQQESVVGDFRWAFDKGSFYFNIAADDQQIGLPGVRKVTPSKGINELRDYRRGSSTPFDYAARQGERGTVGMTYMLADKVELILDGGIRSKDQQAAFFGDFSNSYIDTTLTTASLTPRLNITQPFFGLPSRILTGVDFFKTDYESRRSQLEGLSPIHVYSGNQETLAGYWQQTVNVLPTTSVSVGGRVQHTKTVARDIYDPSAPQDFSGLAGVPLDQSETNRAWHLGAEQVVLPGVTLIARTAQSFRVPNIDERIGSAPFGVPVNFALRTQSSTDWEAGLRLQQGPFKIQSSYYEMRLTDEIQYDPVNFINKNLDPTQRRGVETIASWQLLKTVRIYGNTTYTDAKFREGKYAGNQVPLVSHWTGNAGVSWSLIEKALVFDTIVHYTGARRMDSDVANFQPVIPSHTTLDLQLSGKSAQFFWSAGVANVFDAKYFDYAVASTTALGSYSAYPLPGRTFMVKSGMTW